MHTIHIKNQNILLLSDTHGRHRLLDIPEDIQIVIHCGDICEAGNMAEILDFFDWYGQLDIPHKIFVHGNHDLPFELEPVHSKKLVPENIHWLNDQSISIMGISAFPFFQHIEPKDKYDLIVSHYPPFGILDDGIGSDEITTFIDLFPPKYHVFGHNHTGYGTTKHKNIQYINASIYHTLWKQT